MPFDKKEYMKNYREINKEKKKLRDKLYYEKHKEKIIKRTKEYSKSYDIENPHIKKISDWKNKYGIELRPNEDWLSVYLYWKTCERCEECNVELTDGMGELTCRNLDHDHNTKYIRNVLCWGCNINDPKFLNRMEKIKN